MTGPRDRWLTVLGRPAHLAECGAGTPLILAPGLGLSTRFYRPVLEALGSAGIRFIVPDVPGTGRTPGPFFGSSVAATARFLLALADALELDRPAWLGHSIGCQAALAIAAAHPERVAALVLAAPTGGPWRLLRQLLALPRAALAEPLDLVLAVMRDYLLVWPTSYIGTWLRAGADHPVERLARLRCPTLVLAGGRDPIVHPALVAAVLARVEGARLQRIPGGGHALPRDAVSPFTAATAAFLAALPTAAVPRQAVSAP